MTKFWNLLKPTPQQIIMALASLAAEKLFKLAVKKFKERR